MNFYPERFYLLPMLGIRTLPMFCKTPSKTQLNWGPPHWVPLFCGFAGCLWFTLPWSAQATGVSEVTAVLTASPQGICHQLTISPLSTATSNTLYKKIINWNSIKCQYPRVCFCCHCRVQFMENNSCIKPLGSSQKYRKVVKFRSQYANKKGKHSFIFHLITQIFTFLEDHKIVDSVQRLVDE